MWCSIAKMTKSEDSNCRGSRGYSLLEMAVVLAVVGLILASGASAYRVFLKNDARDTTKTNIADVATAIHGFLGQYSRYPCPAPLDADQGDLARYGLETDCTDTSVAVGDCDDGICVEERKSVIPIVGRPRVRRGAVPFRTLSIFEDASYDGYHRKLSYVVTEELAVAATFDSNIGSISVEDGDGNTVIEPEDSAHFIVFSHGEDRKGGYTSGGAISDPCVGTDRDVENCNTGGGADRFAVYNSMWHDKQGNDKYDDLMSFATEEERPLWRKTDSTGLHIRDLSDLGGTISVGVEPTAGAGPKVAIVGTAKSEENLHALGICNQAGTRCFDPELIAGDVADMNCPVGSFVTGVSEGRVTCETEIINMCPEDSFMTGIDGAGNPTCGTPPASCGTYSRWLCGVRNDFPASTHNTEIDVDEGYNRHEMWRCESGSWRRRENSGSCTCNAYDYETTYGCPTGFTGERVYRYYRECPENVARSELVSNTCTCVGGVPDITQTWGCGTGYTGSRTRTRTFTCTSTTTGGYGSWSSWDRSGCVCQTSTQTQTLSCAYGETGQIDRQRDITCPGNVRTIGDWTVTSDTCTCNPITETRTVPCPEGEVGSVIEERAKECPSGAWSDWTEQSNLCEAITCSWQPDSSSGPASSSFSGRGPGSTCACGTMGSQSCWENAPGGKYFNYPVCACKTDL